MSDLRKMNFDTAEVRQATWDEYQVAKPKKLQESLPLIVGRDFLDPAYFIWRNFLYRYLQAHISSEATNKYTLMIKHKDRRARQLYNTTSYAALASFKAMSTVSTPVFNNVTMSDISKVIETLKMILSSAKQLNGYLLNDSMFKNVIISMLLMDNQAVHFSAFRVYILRKRIFGFVDKELEALIEPKILSWSHDMLAAFDDLKDIIGPDNKIFEFYSEPIREILVRMTETFHTFLMGDKFNCSPIQMIYQDSLTGCNDLTKSFVNDLVSNSPLYEGTTFDAYTVYNLLYFFYHDEENSLCDTCILFVVGDRLYKQAIHKMDKLYNYLTTTDLGEECMTLMGVFLTNQTLHPDEYAQRMNEYLESLLERGFITYTTLEERWV